MKRKISLGVALLMIALSCEGPETTVTNIVNKDGTVLRKVEMKQAKSDFNPKSYRVPLDSTWKYTDSISISEKGDTTWYLFAEKLFESVEPINEAYLSDSGENRIADRSAFFERKFRWFTTTYYFSEKCGKSLLYGYPYDETLVTEEIRFLNLPMKIRGELLSGPDSIKYSNLSDSLNNKLDKWLIRSLISEWIEEAGSLCSALEKDSLSTTMLRSHEDELNRVPDTLTFEETIQKVFGDSTYAKYQTEFDSAISVAQSRFDKSLNFQEYTMQTVMPGTVISSNGYDMPGGEIAWTVRGELFVTADYEMWVKSEVVHYWAWVITGLLVIVIVTGLSARLQRRRGRE